MNTRKLITSRRLQSRKQRRLATSPKRQGMLAVIYLYMHRGRPSRILQRKHVSLQSPGRTLHKPQLLVSAKHLPHTMTETQVIAL